MYQKYETVIGLEVHSQLKTLSKVFCGCSTEFGVKPNSNICPVCTGQPGVLPVLNRKAVELLVKTGLSLNCRINKHSVFARKQYFYPDLPKNFQISQYELPIAEGGFLEIEVEGKLKRIGITRIHLEEDAGKLLHAIGNRELDYSLVDLNRTGVPLMEIVSEPELSSPEEACQYLSKLKSVIEYLEVSDCNMEEGKFRCDANISIRPAGQKELGTKAELKNMNSLKGVKDALSYEISRQIDVVSSGGKIIQETRLWNSGSSRTEPMRTKEEAHDYRYFPEPDLVPLNLDEGFTNKIKEGIPELRNERQERLIKEFGLSQYDAGVLTADKALAEYYEKTLESASKTKNTADIAKPVANWVTTELLGRLNALNKTILESPVSPQNMANLVLLVQDGTISGKTAKTVFDEMFNSGKNADDIVKEKGLVQISDETALEKMCDEAISENAKAVSQYKAGKKEALGAIVGSIMKKSKGKANPQMVNKILSKKLS
ncbi:MAG: Asp-tRNA(Asn)/Glu-tRNA(Gln) amidotransferase subunit GatB [Elusimicrobia bacterium]|nr:Asp-tRNA(Asn)/Glu-tRNA(Gln) amidotransferase subunit GatB [Candidatus Liberimonas magnetica]